MTNEDAQRNRDRGRRRRGWRSALAARPSRWKRRDSFVGSERCGGCHVQEYETWKNSLHAKMVQPTGVGILKDVVDNWSKDGPTKTNLDGKPAKLEDVRTSWARIGSSASS